MEIWLQMRTYVVNYFAISLNKYHDNDNDVDVQLRQSRKEGSLLPPSNGPKYIRLSKLFKFRHCETMLLSALGTFYGFVVSVVNGNVLTICFICGSS